ncbi:MAG: NADH-quinone oxidoreductase subunit L [Verrucomicrobiae bacterium]|nr:NADH-quinone oxidoreductase subunit L [Verrucomicrobiae bacterium]
MSWISRNLWLIPLLPFAAAGITAFFPRAWRRASAATALAGIATAFALSLVALARTMSPAFAAAGGREAFNFAWFTSGETTARLGFLLDPLSAIMLFAVSLISLLVFAFSVGYMDEDDNFTRFFCFLSFFAGSMLALVAANSLLLIFVAWELVGLSSYLLIGFWYRKPSAAAAMKKAFLVTRVGDLGFFIGLLWFYQGAGTSLFYDLGNGALEGARLDALAGGAAATTVALLVFCGAAGKSGQFPLHVWLPDAMEGPTPVSALIHAATMVAAGVFLVARLFPVFELSPAALHAVACLGAFTALFAASIALAQWDLKRILAYSTVSQLGYMMLGLGVGGVVPGIFHLTTHAFFKALLFLGAGAVIHNCHHEQDIRRLGGLKDRMPLTFAAYVVGAFALVGLPPFSGFFSKDEILAAAWRYPDHCPWWGARLPFWAALGGAFLTAFYMTRQVRYAFFGAPRGEGAAHAREAGRWMLAPILILAAISVVAGFVGFPGANRFQAFLHPTGNGHGFVPGIPLASAALILLAIGVAWKVYGPAALAAGAKDPIERRFPRIFALLHGKYFVDELFAATLLRANRALGAAGSWFDRWILDGLAVGGLSVFVRALSFVNHLLDERIFNRGFDRGCGALQEAGFLNRRLQNGLVQHYLKVATAAAVLLAALLVLLTKRNGP